MNRVTSSPRTALPAGAVLVVDEEVAGADDGDTVDAEVAGRSVVAVDEGAAAVDAEPPWAKTPASFRPHATAPTARAPTPAARARKARRDTAA